MTGVSRSTYLNGVREDNERHHQQPGYLTRLSWWENINTTAPIGWSLALVLFLIGAPTFAWLTAFFLSFGNLIHRWSHDPPKRLPKLVVLMQKTGLFITNSHHSGHHYKNGKIVDRKDSKLRFCVMTTWLNPILDRIKFFVILTSILGGCATPDVPGKGFTGRVPLEQCCSAFDVIEGYECPCAVL